jgi:hypothetical protein
MINRLKREGKLIEVRMIQNALAMSVRYERLSHIVHGDNTYFVVTPGVAESLSKAGYEVVGFCGKLY